GQIGLELLLLGDRLLVLRIRLELGLLLIPGLLRQIGFDLEEGLLVVLVLPARRGLVVDGPEGDRAEGASQQEEQPVVGNLLVDLRHVCASFYNALRRSVNYGKMLSGRPFEGFGLVMGP